MKLKETINGLKAINPISLSVNGNNLYYTLIDKDFDFKAIFANNPNIDSIIALEKLENGKYKMFVYEKDGSVSNYCGNGSLGVLTFLKRNKIIFDVDGEDLEVKEENEKLVSEFNIENNLDNLQKDGLITSIELYNEFIEKFGENISGILDFYDKNYLEIYKIFNSNPEYANYISHIISYIDKENFKKFVSNLDIVGLVSSNKEPHLVIKVKENINKKEFDIYQKLLSFLIMYSFKEGKKIFPQATNIMFVDKENKIYSCERGVLNGIKYCQTGSCGTGTTSVAYLLGEGVYKSRSGYNLELKKQGNKVNLIVDKRNIKKIEQDNGKTDNLNIYSQALQEQLEYLLEFFGNNSLEKLSFSLIKEIGDSNLSLIKDKLGTFVFNSGWHENEFPIDPYKLGTYLNQKNIEDKFDINGKILYLDTMTTRKKSLQTYPNVQIGKNKPRILKNVLKYLKESDSFEEFKNNFKQIYKSIFLKDTKANQEFIKLLESLGIDTQESKNITKFLSNSKHVEKISLGFYKFLLTRIKDNWKKLKLNPEKREKLIFKWFQDYFLSLYIEKTFPTLSKKLKNDKIKLFSESNLLKHIKEAIIYLYESSLLKQILEEYFKIIIESKGGKKINFATLKNGNKVFVDYELGKIVYKINDKVLGINELKDNLHQISTFNGVIMLFLFYLTGQLHIGSERGFREIFIKALEFVDNPKFLKLKKYIEISYLTGDYVPQEERPKKVVAGTDNTFTSNIYLSIMLGEEFSNLELKEFLKDYLSPKKIDSNIIYSSLFQEYKVLLENKLEQLEQIKIKALKNNLDNIDISTDSIDKNITFLTNVLLHGISGKNIGKLGNILFS